MKNLNFEKIKSDAQKLILADSNSYIKSYPEFLKYFESIDQIKQHHLVIASHFVYGWMPTILRLDIKNADRVIPLLNNVKNGHLLDKAKLEIIKSCVNNSLVGTSKLLHFINPNKYAIWDSRIFRYCTGKRSQYGIGEPATYLAYLEKLQEIERTKDYSVLHSTISKHFNYPITPMRAIEIVMFETDKAVNNL